MIDANLSNRHPVDYLTDEQLRLINDDQLAKFRHELTTECQFIQVQLSNSPKHKIRGVPATRAEWTRWHVSAQAALAHRQASLRRVKDERSRREREGFSAKAGALKPHTRALVRELTQYQFDQPGDANLRRLMRALVDVAFMNDLEGESILAVVDSWEAKGGAAVEDCDELPF